MFKTITRLLFGGGEETPKSVKSGEVVEEEWLVVTHQGWFQFPNKLFGCIQNIYNENTHTNKRVCVVENLYFYYYNFIFYTIETCPC